MALVTADRVKETSTTTGTGTYDLAGASTGYQTFVAGVGNGNTCYYCATDGTDWEVGIGTVTDASPDTLARTTILASTNANAAVNWAAGTRDIFLTFPAAVAVASDTRAGLAEFATNAETITGTDATRAVTPAGGAAAYQPLDSDLTALAALSTDAAGRSILTLSDPGADRIAFWDDSAGAIAWLTVGSGLTISTTTISANAGYTDLGDIDTSSGASASLGSLTLTDYKMLRLVFDTVSTNGNNSLLIGNSTSDDVTFTGASGGTGFSWDGIVDIDLETGIGFSILNLNGVNTAVVAFDSALSTASTAISVASSAGTLDNGVIHVWAI